MLILLPIALIAFTGVCFLGFCLCVIGKWADADSRRRFERYAARKAAEQ